MPCVGRESGKEGAIMGLLRLAALGALGYVGWKYYEKAKDNSPPAFAKGQEPGENVAKVAEIIHQK